ncbi:MAG: hypothetical protein DME46_06435, partial [Verrucomicrobia bacterium]
KCFDAILIITQIFLANGPISRWGSARILCAVSEILFDTGAKTDEDFLFAPSPPCEMTSRDLID